MIFHNIKVSTHKLLELSNEIRRINDKLYQDLTEIEARLSQSTNIWDSEAGNEIRMAMKQLQGSFFDEYHRVVDGYAIFLEQTIDQYESTENTIKSNASMFM